MKEIVTLAFVGDVMLGRMVEEALAGRPPQAAWGTALPILQGADAVFANLECALTNSNRPWRRTRKVFHFRAAPSAVAVLKAGNIRCVSLANNHVLDFETEGLVETLRHLDAGGIAHAGAGTTLAKARAPALVAVGEIKIGLIALTDNEPAFAATAERPGTWHAAIGDDPGLIDLLSEQVVELRVRGADLVVLSLHWGPNMVTAPPPQFRAFAKSVIDRGVDIVHGHSAHLFQGVEARGRRLVLYDTGDFIDDYAVDPQLRNDWSFVFLVEADREGPRRLELVPVRLNPARVDLARGPERRAILDRMKRLSAALDTELEDSPAGLELPLIEDRAPAELEAEAAWLVGD